MVVFFFFKQKTAYELRISDWSSDVCSSYLATGRDPLYQSRLGSLRDCHSAFRSSLPCADQNDRREDTVRRERQPVFLSALGIVSALGAGKTQVRENREEGRRGGKEVVRRVGSRWAR